MPRWFEVEVRPGEACDGCGTLAVQFDGNWQSSCPVCAPGVTLNAVGVCPTTGGVVAGGYDRAVTYWDLRKHGAP